MLGRALAAALAAALAVAAVAEKAAAEEFFTLKGHGGPIMGLAMSPEGVLASASFDNSVGLWRGRAPTWLDGHEAAAYPSGVGRLPCWRFGG